MSEIAANRQSDDHYSSPPVQRAARLLRHIGEGDAVTNMARKGGLGINRTTLRAAVARSRSRTFHRTASRRQRLAYRHRLITLTAQAFFSDDLVQTAVPVLTRLAERLALSAHLGVLDGREIVYLVRRVPNHVFASNIRVGSRLPAHAAIWDASFWPISPLSRSTALCRRELTAGHAAYRGHARAVACPARHRPRGGTGLERRQL